MLFYFIIEREEETSIIGCYVVLHDTIFRIVFLNDLEA